MTLTCTPTVAAVEPLRTRLDDPQWRVNVNTRGFKNVVRIVRAPDAQSALKAVLGLPGVTHAHLDSVRLFSPEAPSAPPASTTG